MYGAQPGWFSQNFQHYINAFFIWEKGNKLNFLGRGTSCERSETFYTLMCENLVYFLL